MNSVEYVGENPVSVIVDGKKFEEFFAHVSNEVLSAPVDLTTDKGRKAVASLAYRVAQTKTAIDKAGKEMTDEYRQKVASIDKVRKDIRDRLDDLKSRVRAPLDEWEAAEEKRKESVKATLNFLADATFIDARENVEALRARLATLREFGVSDEVMQDSAPVARERLKAAVAAVETAIETKEREAAERAELARLRAEMEERDRREAEARAASERAERERAAKEREAEEKARREAEMERRIREAAEREAAEKVAAAEREKQEAIAAAERKEAERLAAEKRAEDEARQRAADLENRMRVMEKAARSMARAVSGLNVDTARSVIEAIDAGAVHGVKIEF